MARINEKEILSDELCDKLCAAAREKSKELGIDISFAVAARHDLLVTGGSDWHGKGKPNGLGENLTDDDTVREILHRGVDLIGRVGSSHAA